MIDVAVHNAHSSLRVPSRGAVRVVSGVFRREHAVRWRVSVVFSDDRMSRRINRKFLRHDRPTDVLAFPLGRDDGRWEGEIYINLDKAARQARTYGVTAANEVARLLIHGSLHLLGYDDISATKRNRMKAREDRYVLALAAGDTKPR